MKQYKSPSHIKWIALSRMALSIHLISLLSLLILATCTIASPNNPLLSDGSNDPLLSDGSNDLPASIDWRARGAVTSVKDSGSNCIGGSWAFATTGAIESAYQIATGRLVDLSAQQLLDCERKENKGCVSGFPQYAFMYLADGYRALHTASDYPFTATNSSCKNKDGFTVAIDGYDNLYSYSEDSEIKELVARQPVTAVVDGKSSAFINYKRGIFSGPCSDSFVSLSVLIVGYGKENGQEYWIIKNSWGTSWGENGYMRLQTGRCSLNSFVWYPTKTPGASSPEGLVGWWKLNEKLGNVAKDSSPSSADATMYGPVTWASSGTGLTFFTSGGWVFAGTAPSLCGKTPFTIAVWIRTNYGGKGIVVQQRGPTSSRYPSEGGSEGSSGVYQVYVMFGKVWFWVWGDSSDQWRFSASSVVNDGKWHHVAAVRDGGEGRIYVDGSLKGSASGVVKNLVSNIPVCIGRDCGYYGDGFIGTVADVRVYSRALGDSEISKLAGSVPSAF